MKKIINILILVVVIVIAVWYFTTRTDTPKTQQVSTVQYATFSDGDLGLEFKYPAGPDGYVLSRGPSLSISSAHIQTLILFQEEDVGKMPEGGEGPPGILIQVFENTKKQTAEVWANENMVHSNINLKMGEVGKTKVGDIEAISYMSDGLYASENVVIAHDGKVYIVTGQFLDRESDLRRDFAPLVASIRFVSKANQ